MCIRDRAVTSYTDALMLLDQYDHQSLKKPVGNRPIYKITYEAVSYTHLDVYKRQQVMNIKRC